jgi:hypothetical protein
MQNRDERILKHVALHRLSIRAVIEHLFFEGKSCDDVINRLVSKDRLLSAEKLPDRISYYRLTLTAARARGVQENRARNQGVQTRSIRRALAMLWFCCMGQTVRHKIERQKLRQLFADAPGMGIPHCWEPLDEVRRLVYRVYTPGPNTPSDDVVRTLRLDADAAIANGKLAPVILAKRYTFAVLVENEDRKKQICEQIEKGIPLPLTVLIEVVPNAHTLATAIRDHRTKRGYTNERAQ